MVWTQAKAVAVLAAVDASAQGFFSSLNQQVATCGAIDGPNNFYDMGCYTASSTPVTGLFEIANYVPGNTISYQQSYPQFWGNILSPTKFNATVTPYTCGRACQGYGYKNGHLLNNRCYCSALLPAGARTTYSNGVDTPLCNVACAGDFNQFCGGASTANGVSVSVDPTFPSDADIRSNSASVALGYKYLGCFNLGSQGFRNNRAATNSASQDACRLRCAQEGYPYSAFSSLNSECDCGVSFGPGSYQINRPVDTCESGTPNGVPVAVNPDLQGCYIPPVPGYGNLDAQSRLVSYNCAPQVTFDRNNAVRPLTVSSTGSNNKVNSVLPVRQREVGPFYIRGCSQTDLANVFDSASYVPKGGASSLELCANLCANYEYFGLQNGGVLCGCGNTIRTEPDTDMSVCNRKCASSPRQNCGSGSGPIVYAKGRDTNTLYSSISTTLTLSARATYSCIAGSSSTSASSSAFTTSSADSASSVASASSGTVTSSVAVTSSGAVASSAAGSSSATGSSSAAGMSSGAGTSSAARTSSPAAASSSPASSIPVVVPSSPSTGPNVQTSNPVLQSPTSCGTCAFTASTSPSSTSARPTSAASPAVSSAASPAVSSATSSVGGEVPTTSASAGTPSVMPQPSSITSAAATPSVEPLQTVTIAYPEHTDYAAAADVPVGVGIKSFLDINGTSVDVVVQNEGCYVKQPEPARPFLPPEEAIAGSNYGDPETCAGYCYKRKYDFNGAVDDSCYCGNATAPTGPTRYTQIDCPRPNSPASPRSFMNVLDIAGRSLVQRADNYLQIFRVLNAARVRAVLESDSSTTSSLGGSTSSLALGSSTSGAGVGTTPTPNIGGSSTSVVVLPTLSTASGMFANSSTASGGFANSSTATAGSQGSTSGGPIASLSTPSSILGQSSATAGGPGSSPGGSGPIPPPTIPGGGPGPSSGPNNGGTIITSSSTQYFTVTTGIPGSSQTGPASGGGSLTSMSNGSLGPSQAPSGSASGTLPSGSAVPSADVFVIGIGPADPRQSGAPGSKARRQSSGFIGNAGVNNPVECSQATQFAIIDGELTSGGQKVSTNPGVAAAPLAVSPAVGLITRTWGIVDDELLWVNAAFAGGQTTFCLDATTRKVFFVTTGAGTEPDGCTLVSLTPLFGKLAVPNPFLVVSDANHDTLIADDCDGLNPDNGLLPAEETLILPPGIYFPGGAPGDQVCRVTSAYWVVGQFTLSPAPTGLPRREL